MSPAPVLAFLDVGPTELLLLVALFLLLFGADKVPQLARSVGKATAQFRSASRQFSEQLDAEQGEAFRPGDAVPQDRKEHIAAVEAEALQQLQQAARALGIDPAGQDEAALRAAIAARVSKEG